MKSQKLALESTEKKTRQRREVLRVLQKAYGPLSSFEIHDLARQNLPNIGLTTIYRTLRIMQREGNVRSVVLPDGVMRFEATRLGQHHFQCRVCQQIWTLHSKPIEALSQLKLSGGFVIEDHNTTFYGCCPTCKKEVFASASLETEKQRKSGNRCRTGSRKIFSNVSISSVPT